MNATQIKMTSKADHNGNHYQLIVDFEQKTITTGYCLFGWGADSTMSNKKDIKQLAEAFEQCGFARING